MAWASARGSPSVRVPLPARQPPPVAQRPPAPSVARGGGTSRLGYGEPRQPRQPFEVAGRLKKSGQVTLDSTGGGIIPFTPDNAWQRWEVDTIVVRTNQAATSTPVPAAEIFVNSTQSQGNSEGSTDSGNRDTFIGRVEIGPCDNLNVAFTGGIPGSVATAIVTGSRYTRRA